MRDTPVSRVRRLVIAHPAAISTALENTRKKRRLILCCCAVALTIVLALPTPAQNIKGVCVSGCGPAPSTSRSSNNNVYTPSADEVERQRRLSAATAWNQQGNVAYERHDWAEALRCYESAIENSPNDLVIQRNLGHAQNQVGVDFYNKEDWESAVKYFREAAKNDPANTVLAGNLKTAEEKLQAVEYQKQQQIQEAKTAEQMRGTIGQLSSTIKATPETSTPGLDFVASKPSGPGGDLKEAPAGTPPAAQAHGMSSSHSALGGSTSAGDQLKSAAKHAKAALTLGDNGVDDLRKPFDTAGSSAGSLDTLAVDASHAGQQKQKPVAAAVANNPDYKKLQSQKQELEKKYQEADQKLQQIRQQQAAGTGDQTALTMEAVKVKGELSPLRSQIATVQIKMDDMSVSFEEQHPPAKTPTAGKTAPQN